MAYTRKFKDGSKRIASIVYLRKPQDNSAKRIAKRERRSKSSVLVKILEDNLL